MSTLLAIRSEAISVGHGLTTPRLVGARNDRAERAPCPLRQTLGLIDLLYFAGSLKLYGLLYTIGSLLGAGLLLNLGSLT